MTLHDIHLGKLLNRACYELWTWIMVEKRQAENKRTMCGKRLKLFITGIELSSRNSKDPFSTPSLPQGSQQPNITKCLKKVNKPRKHQLNIHRQNR